MFFLLYLASAPGDLIGDTELRWRIAERLVATGWIDLPEPHGFLTVIGRDGKNYSFYGLGQPLMLVPFVLFGQWAHQWAPERIDAGQAGQFLASLLLFPSFGALAVAMLFALVLEITSSRSAARWAAAAAGLGTMHWHHTVNTYEESQIAVCALAILWAVHRESVAEKFGNKLVASVALGAALFFRVSSLMIAGPIFLTAIGASLLTAWGPVDRRSRLWSWTLPAALGLAPFVVAIGLLNFARFGSPWETGYGLMVWDGPIHLFATPLLVGLSGLMLSPGKSYWLFNPILVFAIPGLVLLFRKNRAVAVAVLASFATAVLFHAKYTFWSGDLAWGPRYLACLAGPMAIALLPFCTGPDRPRKPFLVVLVISVIVQVASVTYNFGLEFFQDRRHGTIPDAYVWRPSESQLVCRFRNIFLHAMGRPNDESIPPHTERPVTHQTKETPDAVRKLHAVNIFPFKARAFGAGTAMFTYLVVLWAFALVCLVFVVWRWTKITVSDNRDRVS